MAKRAKKTAKAAPAESTAGTALEQYKWKPGQSGNPGGRPAVIREVRDIARGYTVEAMETLAKIMGDGHAPCAARVAAAAHILDRGYGKPQQNISATVRSIKQMTDDELLAYIVGAEQADSGEGASETASNTRLAH